MDNEDTREGNLALLYHVCRSFSSTKQKVLSFFGPGNPLQTASFGFVQKNLPCLVHQQFQK